MTQIDSDVSPASSQSRAVAWLFARPWRLAAFAGLGSFLTILLLTIANATEIAPLLIAPFGASCALVFGAPASPLARPYNVVGGHLVTAACGLLVATCIGSSPIAIALGVGIAISAMLLTDTLHPPAGANPIVIALAHSGWTFLVAPIVIGATFIVICGSLYHRLVTGHSYKLTLSRRAR
ncbi:HPP family protein [Hyphomicrobium sp.]|uniref:HPP family protein n=1 Tax=Hyphomicrobium sp. TaxID=82 RepID=UPI001D2CA25C|nr:HPP family protein [Hyphomicrobium sp.]MBY0562332.1 HPP family protein [Hyphomicrobium sp.]